MRPGRPASTRTRSARKIASGIECVTSWIVVRVLRHSDCSITLKRSRVSASRALNGSSRSSTPGSSASARAMATRCRVPPESWCGRSCSISSVPTNPNRSRARASRAVRDQPASSRGRTTLSRAERHGRSRGSWKTNPTPRSGARTVRSPTVTWPCPGSSRPATSLRRVLFPVPFAPMTATSSPGSTSKETPSSAARGGSAG